MLQKDEKKSSKHCIFYHTIMLAIPLHHPHRLSGKGGLQSAIVLPPGNPSLMASVCVSSKKLQVSGQHTCDQCLSIACWLGFLQLKSWTWEYGRKLRVGPARQRYLNKHTCSINIIHTFRFTNTESSPLTLPCQRCMQAYVQWSNNLCNTQILYTPSSFLEWEQASHYQSS